MSFARSLQNKIYFVLKAVLKGTCPYDPHAEGMQSQGGQLFCAPCRRQAGKSGKHPCGPLKETIIRFYD